LPDDQYDITAGQRLPDLVFGNLKTAVSPDDSDYRASHPGRIAGRWFQAKRFGVRPHFTGVEPIEMNAPGSAQLVGAGEHETQVYSFEGFGEGIKMWRQRPG